ncbi:MAG: class I SAM-dependent rRNA methyltransferase [Myxococcales bacterium]|nr:class I SAM-dependent rRNA methyltransferase [Myxococcales bacterium]MCB9569248.1 class I SAM-dependent rRNA methyltransferase [Myxococcales bacterium]MCB9706119.1 class I SAM-dependent rRNA methyltransferase [Myxococcales bacterium]
MSSPPGSASRSRKPPVDASGDRGGGGGGRRRPEVRPSGPPKRKRGDKNVRPGVRGPNVKVTQAVARLLRGGHPWIFRSALRRETELAEGSVISVIDDDGYSIGWGLVEGEGAIAVRMLSLAPELSWDAAEMSRRVAAALALRVGLGLPEAHRIIHGEADGFPGIAVDRMGDFLLIYKYAKIAETYLDTLIPILAEQAMPAGGGIYLQDRVRPVTPDDRRPPAFHVAGKAAPPDVEVDEDGQRYLVDVTAPVSPGLFYDLREGRRLVEAWSRDRSVLNLFSFTGAFALRALRGGARSVTNVDAAARSHARCRQNLAASGLDPEAAEALTGDVFRHLERFRQRGRVFDMVVVDPPPFSNVKGAVFSALRDYGDLLTSIAPVVAPGGLVLAVCNAVRLSEEEFLLALGEGAAAAGRSARLLGECGLPPDFPVLPAFIEGRYLKVKLLQLP